MFHQVKFILLLHLLLLHTYPIRHPSKPATRKVSQYNYPQAPVVYPPPPASYPPPPGAYVPPGQVYPPPPPPVAAHLSYPPPVQAGYSQGPFVAPPPVGYPMKSGPGYPQQEVPHPKTKHRGGFWKGCCAAMCCCCLLDICF
ncbi:hypothetical protein F2P56_006524 [Juglans regia]|uniref:Cysteine-rich and transmembrane domain-containing protein B-like isoform X2 n=2 Tax=Juglans regia TaxID=51240 RepID=A0A6P9EAD3_JUGRE|nr:cysteine-rich and transmembrane domain-containing protein B-like isoform X2 [Juglans regia]KAF5474641.1 hypothetical protein F2P56_006524 [Juglans regia]